MKKYISMALLLALSLLAGCGETDNGPRTDAAAMGGGNPVDAAAAAEVDFSRTDAELFTDRDHETGYDEDNSILVKLDGASAAASSDSVRISGTTITITENTTHIISGTLDDGMIIVDAGDTAKLQLVLNGVSIHSETSAPLYILGADKVFVTLADGTDNVLSNGGAFTAIDNNNIDSVIFSRQDLTLNGSGTLTVLSPAGHGIVSKDDLVITGGTYHVSSASHGLDVNDSVRITGNTSLAIDAGKDGIHAENKDDASLGFVYISDGTVKIEAEGDGISAGAYMQLEGGTLDILAGGGSENGTKEFSDFWGGFRGGRPDASAQAADDGSSSMKGIKAGGGILLSDGTVRIDSADDAIHSHTSVTINGGTFEMASGDDAVHADESLVITAGNINISESYEGLEALSIAVTGGDIRLVARDDGINAAGGTDSNGINGGRDAMFGGEDRVFGGQGGFGGRGEPGGQGGFGDRGEPGGRGGHGVQGVPGSQGSMSISGGSIYIEMGGDGLDANGRLSITGGTIVVSGANSGDTSILDFDTEGTIGGGTFIGTGAFAMAQNFSPSSTQGAIMVTTGSQPSGTEIRLTDSSGNAIVSHTADRDFSCVILSHASIAKGETYMLTVGSADFDITMNDTVYSTANPGGMGGGRIGNR